MLLLRIGILALITFFATSARGQEDSSQDPQLQHQTESSVDNSASTPVPKIVFELEVPPKVLLAAESVDPAWSEETESRLRQRIRELLDTTYSVPEIECRSTMCGFGFHLAQGSIDTSSLCSSERPREAPLVDSPLRERPPMIVESCIPVIPSADLEKSLRFWVDGLGLMMDREMRHEGKLIGCMVHNSRRSYFWLNQRAGTPVKPEDYEGIRLYWAPSNIHEIRNRLKQLGYAVSDIVERDYGQTEFFVTDDDGFSHCFGVATKA